MIPKRLNSISPEKGKRLEDVIREHYKTVCSLARKYSALGFSKEELISEGILGLIFALEKFDKIQNIKFSTYAFYWIRGKMLKFIDKSKWKDFEEDIFQSIKYINDRTQQRSYKVKISKDAKLRFAVDLLPLIEKRVIQQRWINQSEKTLAELSETIGVSQERIRQIEKKAITNLKEILKENFNSLDIYLILGRYFFKIATIVHD